MQMFAPCWQRIAKKGRISNKRKREEMEGGGRTRAEMRNFTLLDSIIIAGPKLVCTNATEVGACFQL